MMAYHAIIQHIKDSGLKLVDLGEKNTKALLVGHNNHYFNKIRTPPPHMCNAIIFISDG